MAVIACERPVPAAREDQGQTILLDVGDLAVRWQYGNRFATSIGTSDVVDGAYISWDEFNFSLLPLFHRGDRLIMVAAMEVSAVDGEVRVYQGRRMDLFLASRRKSLRLDRELLELVAILHLCDRLPERRALVAVRARSVQRGATRHGPLLHLDRLLATEVEHLVLGWQSKRNVWRRP